jgi:drug/metabolite transporter (DMT)-like permease
MRSQTERLAFGAGLLACVSWACGSVLSKALLERIHPLDFLTMQLGMSTIWLWLLSCAFVRLPDAGDWRFAWPGILQPGLAYGLSIFGLAAIAASLETMLFAAESAITLLLAWPLLNERPRPAFIVLTAIAFAGVALLSWDGQFSSKIGPLAIVLVLAGVTCASLYSCSLKRLKSGSSTLAVTTVSQTSGLGLVIFAWLVWHGGVPGTLPLADLPLIGLSGLLLYGISFLLVKFTLENLSASTAGGMLPVVPILTAIIAHFALDETMSAIQWIGSAAVLCATGFLVLLGDQTIPHARKALTGFPPDP